MLSCGNESPTDMRQFALFTESQSLPHGLVYRDALLAPGEEAALLSIVSVLPFEAAQYKQYTAKRRTVSYGSSYDFGANESLPAPAIPDFLLPLRERVASLAAVPATAFVQAMIAEYWPGTQLGWHRDVPEFEVIAGISLAGACRMRFRPYPWTADRKKEVFALQLQPGSAYVLRDQARWQWQHSIAPTDTVRYSVTFRTRR